MKLKKFMVYLDDGRDAFRCAIPAASEKKAREYVQGNGEVVAVKDVTAEYPIDANKVAVALAAASFGQTEIDLIVRTLTSTEIAE